MHYLLSILFSISISASIYNELTHLTSLCSTKRVHLTFDDGPDENMTPQILKTLNKYQLKASFFVSTSNIDSELKKDILNQILNEGHILASHGYEHKAHDLRIIKKDGKLVCSENILSKDESLNQIELSHIILNQITKGQFGKQAYKLFRFPYGRGAMPSKKEIELIKQYGPNANACLNINQSESNLLPYEYSMYLDNYRQKSSQPLKLLHSKGFDHVGWNFDSMDSQTSVVQMAQHNPSAYASNILKNLCRSKNNDLIALFHDSNKSFNINAIERIIQDGQKLGIQFVNYNELPLYTLVSNGVVQPKPVSLAINKSITAVPVTQAPPNHPMPFESNDNLCYSTYSKSYHNQCQGKDSICINGQWFSRSNIKEVGRICPQIYKTCKSDYGKKETYSHCGGVSSICIDGKWVSKSDDIVVHYCKINRIPASIFKL